MSGDRWSRGDKIALLSLFVAVLSVVVGLYQIPGFAAMVHGEPVRSFIPPGPANADSAAAVQRMTALRKDRRRQERALIKQHEHRLHTHVDRIALQNDCEVEIAIALSYLALDGKWVTEGWANLAPGKLLRTNVRTRNRFYFYYAEGGDQVWSAKDDTTGVRLKAVNHWFTAVGHADDDLRAVDKVQTLDFRRAKTADQWGWQTLTFMCD